MSVPMIVPYDGQPALSGSTGVGTTASTSGTSASGAATAGLSLQLASGDTLTVTLDDVQFWLALVQTIALLALLYDRVVA